MKPIVKTSSLTASQMLLRIESTHCTEHTKDLMLILSPLFLCAETSLELKLKANLDLPLPSIAVTIDLPLLDQLALIPERGSNSLIIRRLFLYCFNNTR